MKSFSFDSKGYHVTNLTFEL